MFSRHLKVSRKTLAVFLAVVLITSITSAFVTYQYVKAQSSSLSPMTFSSGPQPGAPTYTVFTDGTNYYAKDAYGATNSAWTSTNAATTINDAISATPSFGLVQLLGNITITSPIIINTNPVNLEFSIIFLGSGLTQDGIEVLNVGHTGGTNTWGTTGISITGSSVQVASTNSAWNASAIYLENSNGVVINIHTIFNNAAVAGIGIEYYAGNTEWCMGDTIENLNMMRYFITGIYWHTTSTGVISQNYVLDSWACTGATYGILLYCNGANGVFNNQFTNVAGDTPNTSKGYGIWMGDGPSGYTDGVAANTFINYVCWDLTGSAKYLYIDNTVLDTEFYGGYVGAGFPALATDNGINTMYFNTQNAQTNVPFSTFTNIKWGDTGAIANGTWIADGLQLASGKTPDSVILTPTWCGTGNGLTLWWVPNSNSTAFEVCFNGVSYATFNYAVYWVPNNPYDR